MAMRSVVRRVSPNRLIEGTGRFVPRYFSETTKGRVLSEEERAAENVYVQKMEREKMEKLKLKKEKEKAAAEKEQAEKKLEEGPHKG
ncbi:PREDICTED: uncharacterized protein At2g27730, mitochondrial [Nelumbo nucifera]|uniref:Uncharacterized protein At2g27730, mitochondrial n=2 Tax=Nelumbo nucifera TaxID=4432 RepID=A0A1U7YXL1_NELNU|nr:PREDICTED: uncharacterized protein At2g27730, mitochondrial [Nelumbo nucifera]DAD48517.1 TPA_asm: hypothetical protein HUJ06_018454 [Nelumbo nucifera]